MRSKEVEEAINNLKRDIDLAKDAKDGEGFETEVLCDKYDLKTALNYIEKLEKLPNKIRDKIEEINEEFEKNNCACNYGTDYYIASEQYAFCEQKLKELLEEEK